MSYYPSFRPLTGIGLRWYTKDYKTRKSNEKEKRR